MSTKKTTTTAKAPATKPTAKATKPSSPAKKEAAPKAAPAKATKPAPAAKPAAKAKAPLTPFQQLFDGLPVNPKECSAEQVKELSTRYAPVKATFTTEEQAKVREYGLAASAAVKAAAAAKSATATVTDKELQSLINEMNQVMDLEPLIIWGEDHMARITAECKDLRPADFDSTSAKCFTTEARATFRKLGITLPGEKKAKAAKAAKAPGAPRKAGSPRTVDGKPCSKTVVYLAWKKGQTDAEKLTALSGVSAALTTVRGWVSAWKNGKNLPAIAAQVDK